MTHCHIVPLEWSATCGELRLLWRRWKDRQGLIDLDLARAYFRPTAASIDATGEVPILGPPKTYRYEQYP